MKNNQVMTHHKDDSVLMLARKDNRNVLILSTWHNNQREPVRRVTKMNEEKNNSEAQCHLRL